MGQKFGALEDFSPQEFPRHVEDTFVTVAGCVALGFTLECTKIRDDLDEKDASQHFSKNNAYYVWLHACLSSRDKVMKF